MRWANTVLNRNEEAMKRNSLKRCGRGRGRGFSLIELVIVVVIMGIIAAIAIPRMSRGAAGAQDSATKANLAMLENAIELYAVEHTQTYPAVADIATKLTGYTDTAGADWTEGTSTGDKLGPYLKAVPKNRKGKTTIVATGSADAHRRLDLRRDNAHPSPKRRSAGPNRDSPQRCRELGNRSRPPVVIRPAGVRLRPPRLVRLAPPARLARGPAGGRNQRAGWCPGTPGPAPSQAVCRHTLPTGQALSAESGIPFALGYRYTSQSVLGRPMLVYSNQEA